MSTAATGASSGKGVEVHYSASADRGAIFAYDRDASAAKDKYLLWQQKAMDLLRTGLAPFVSMIETLRDRGQTRDLVLLHGASHDFDLAWRAELETLMASGDFPLRYAGTVSRPQNCPDWQGLTGRVEAGCVVLGPGERESAEAGREHE